MLGFTKSFTTNKITAIDTMFESSMEKADEIIAEVEEYLDAGYDLEDLDLSDLDELFPHDKDRVLKEISRHSIRN